MLAVWLTVIWGYKMNTFTLDAWCKPPGAARSSAIGNIHFHVSDEMHLKLERAEEQLSQRQAEKEMEIPADLDSLELALPTDCSELKDCHFHVYMRQGHDRGQFFLVGHRSEDNALIYSNAVMVDLLG